MSADDQNAINRGGSASELQSTYSEPRSSDATRSLGGMGRRDSPPPGSRRPSPPPPEPRRGAGPGQVHRENGTRQMDSSLAESKRRIDLLGSSDSDSDSDLGGSSARGAKTAEAKGRAGAGASGAVGSGAKSPRSRRRRRNRGASEDAADNAKAADEAKAAAETKASTTQPKNDYGAQLKNASDGIFELIPDLDEEAEENFLLNSVTNAPEERAVRVKTLPKWDELRDGDGRNRVLAGSSKDMDLSVLADTLLPYGIAEAEMSEMRVDWTFDSLIASIQNQLDEMDEKAAAAAKPKQQEEPTASEPSTDAPAPAAARSSGRRTTRVA